MAVRYKDFFDFRASDGRRFDGCIGFGRGIY
jgi:hypothetical protein